jgi:hypothetical protein
MLVADIRVNDDFLSLPSRFNEFLFAFSNQKLKDKKNKVLNQNQFF